MNNLQNSNMKVLDEFNKTLDEFINKMILQFPQETKLKTYYSSNIFEHNYLQEILSCGINVPELCNRDT